MPKKANHSCLYCETVLEECIGALGICPTCRGVWTEEEYLEVLNNKCPECGTYPRLNMPIVYDYYCGKCDHEWNEEVPEQKLPLITYAVNFEELLAEVEKELEAADKKHGPMLEPVEGWYTTLCEITEWQREIFRLNKDPEAAYHECIQSITMHIKWIRDCLPMIIEAIKEKKNGNN